MKTPFELFKIFPTWNINRAKDSFFRIERQLSFLEIYQNRILSFICDIFGCPIFPPVDLYLISEKSIWKNKSSTNWIFPTCFFKINTWLVKGPFKYYVIMFLTFLGPPTYLFDDFQYFKSSEIAIFWPHPPTSLMT